MLEVGIEVGSVPPYLRTLAILNVFTGSAGSQCLSLLISSIGLPCTPAVALSLFCQCLLWDQVPGKVVSY